MTNKWTQNDIPDQQGKLIIVTGGNSGIGYEAALALAGRNAHVILAVRSVDKGEEAAREIRQRHPQATGYGDGVKSRGLEKCTSLRRVVSRKP